MTRLCCIINPVANCDNCDEDKCEEHYCAVEEERNGLVAFICIDCNED